jgi:hypothetical protein
LGYLTLSRAPFVLLSLRESALLDPSAWATPLVPRIAGVAACVIFWVGLGAFLQRVVSRKAPEIDAPVFLLAGLGWGMLLVLVAGCLGIGLNRGWTNALLVAPLFALVAGVALRGDVGEAAPAVGAAGRPPLALPCL